MKVSKHDISLNLECWVEGLSTAQLTAYENASKEHKSMREKLKNLMSTNEGKELFNGDFFSAYSFNGSVLQEYNETVLPKRQGSESDKSLDRSQRASKKRAASNLSYIESEDEEDDLPLAKRIGLSTKPKTKIESKQLFGNNPKNIKTSKSQPSLRNPTTAVPNKPSKNYSKIQGGKATQVKVSQEKTKISENFRPSETSSVGGLEVGGDKHEQNKAGTSSDSKDAKLQGKTFPSLVVLAKPWLKVKDMSSTRSKLDSKVKLVLMLTPNKFTEWLIQEGLLKAEQKCTNHPNSELKLGVYSDASKFPYSGGYVWISECCPTRFVSVFHRSLFEGAPHPPSCILKLIYHWSCQTNIQNVVQWVKVDNVYIKGVYTWLRAICTLSVNQKCRQLGGPGKYVEIGVISLGTTSQDGQQRQVKVEVLGVYDYSEKSIRLRAIEPVSEVDLNYKKRFQTILEPLSRWVHKDSIISIDLTVDKITLFQLGFKNIVQAGVNEASERHTNIAVMEYLRRVVPRMFQNTLSLLSRQMIQQFLDELVWREHFGTYALQAFNNITTHIAEQTRLNTNETLTQRLYQVATNPFRDWSLFNSQTNDPPSTAITPKRLKKPINEADYLPIATIVPISAVKPKSEKKEGKVTKKIDDLKNEKPTGNKQSKPATSLNVASKKELKAKNIEDDSRGLEELYYGIKDGLEMNFENLPNEFQIECPICLNSYNSNEKLQTHLVSHISIDDKNYQFQCLFCLEKHQSENVLTKHNQLMHPTETKTNLSASYHCIICQSRFNNLHFLTVHLQKMHHLLELPYLCCACGYKSSSHRDVIRHYYDDHKKQNFLQCPFCLSIYKIYTNGRNLNQNVISFYRHLKKHLLKRINKKCNKCSLSFHQVGSFKMHQMFDHQSNLKAAPHIRQLLSNSVLIQIPKNKYSPREVLPYVNQEKYDKLLLWMEAGNMCAECNEEISDSEHFIGQLKCNKCEYVTSCQRIMLAHSAICDSTSQQLGSLKLDSEMHCICGWMNSDANLIATHLATCRLTTVYLSADIAQENTVKLNMLDMLGLMRRDEGDVIAANDVTQSLEEMVGNVRVVDLAVDVDDLGNGVSVSLADAVADPSNSVAVNVSNETVNQVTDTIDNIIANDIVDSINVVSYYDNSGKVHNIVAAQSEIGVVTDANNENKSGQTYNDIMGADSYYVTEKKDGEDRMADMPLIGDLIETTQFTTNQDF